jgi:hypothetical protein
MFVVTFAGLQTVGSVPNATTFTFPEAGLTTPLRITNRSINGTVATLTTPINHVFPVADQIVVNSGDPRFDGTYQAPKLTGGGQTPGGTTLTVTLPAVSANVTNASATGGTITLAASAADFEQNDKVAVSGVGLAYNGSPLTLTAPASRGSSLAYAAPEFNTSSWSGAGATITITTASAYGLKANNKVTISGFGGM